MARQALIIVVAACCFATLNFGQSRDQKQAADLDLLRQRAEKGDVKAQVQLGFMHEFGDGAMQWEKNYSEALKWYRMAAAQGSAIAKQRIADMYFKGKGVARDYSEAARWYGCPKPSIQALATCKEIGDVDLPKDARSLLTRMKCDAEPYGIASDLNGDGYPEFQVCCHAGSHGPCGAVLIGKVGSTWKDVGPVSDVLGYMDGCGVFIVLYSRHDGFNDVCLPNPCSMGASANERDCEPTILQFRQGRYRRDGEAPTAPAR